MNAASVPMVDVVVVGGGAAGLSAASSLADLDLRLLERENRLGGRLHSLDRGEDWINLGAHLLTGGDSAIQRLADRYELPVRAIPGITSALWFGGRLHRGRRVEAYPLSLPLTLRQRVALARIGLQVRLLAARWSRAARRRGAEETGSYRRRLRSHQADRTFADVLEGCDPGVAEIFRTAARRSSGEADQITVGGAAALFGALWVGSSVVNIEGGSGRLGAAVEKELGDRAVLGAEVTEVVEHDDRVEVAYRVGILERRLTARQAIVAVPAPDAVRMVRSLPGEVAAELGTVRYGSFVCLGVLTSALSAPRWDDVYAIAAPGTVFDMLFHHSNPFRAPGGSPSRRSLMCYVGGRRAQDLLELDDGEVERLLLADLLRVLPEVAGAVEETVVKKWAVGNSLPAPGTRLDRTEAWNRRADGRVFLSGDYFGALGGTIEAATAAGLESAAMIVRDAPPPPPGCSTPPEPPQNGTSR